MKLITCDKTEVEKLRKAVRDWLREIPSVSHVICAWSLDGFTRIEGMNYWSTYLTTLESTWGIHIYDDGRIQRVS